jgi:hypothetical protein
MKKYYKEKINYYGSLINTTAVALTELEGAPAGTSYTSTLSFETSGRYGWNEGTFGSATYGYYTWDIDFVIY